MPRARGIGMAKAKKKKPEVADKVEEEEEEQISTMLRCKTASSAFLDSCSAFAIVTDTLHHGGLWGCPLVYSTTIAPSQRATWGELP